MLLADRSTCNLLAQFGIKPEVIKASDLYATKKEPKAKAAKAKSKTQSKAPKTSKPRARGKKSSASVQAFDDGKTKRVCASFDPPSEDEDDVPGTFDMQTGFDAFKQTTADITDAETCLPYYETEPEECLDECGSESNCDMSTDVSELTEIETERELENPPWLDEDPGYGSPADVPCSPVRVMDLSGSRFAETGSRFGFRQACLSPGIPGIRQAPQPKKYSGPLLCCEDDSYISD